LEKSMDKLEKKVRGFGGGAKEVRMIRYSAKNLLFNYT
jgi:hypothetical protein